MKLLCTNRSKPSIADDYATSEDLRGGLRITLPVPLLILAYRARGDSGEPAAGLAGELMGEVQSAEGQ